jgi:hypothetical protein
VDVVTETEEVVVVETTETETVATVKPIIAGFALDHQTTVIGFLADTQDVSIFCL